MDITWHSFDLFTGRRGPQVKVQALGKVEELLSSVTSLQVQVLMWNEAEQEPWPGWEAATNPCQAMLVAVDTETQGIVWGGYVTTRNASTGTWAAVTLSSMEGYLDRRFVEDHDFVEVDQSTIFTTLVADAMTDGPPFVVEIANDELTHRPRDRTYRSDEDKTVLSAVTELSEVQDGLEFTARLEWTDATQTAIHTVVRVGWRVGQASTTPSVVLTLPGNVTTFDYLEDGSAENLANDVQAVSSGEGETRPESAVHSSRPPTMAKFQRRFTPSTSISNVDTLDEHAAAELAQTWDGLKELKVTARLDQVPHPSTWSIGDDIAVSLTCPRFPERRDPDGAVQPGFLKVIRALGREIDFDALTVTPRLVEIQEAP